MPHYTYLVVGGGMTADAAIHGIREVDPRGTIGLIGRETLPPYARPPLSKGLWKGAPIHSIRLEAERRGVESYLGREVTGLDPRSGRVVDDRGTWYSFDKLLLATGGVPRRLPFGEGQVIYYRTLEDFRRLRELTGRGSRFAVVGGGFIGSEIAAALLIAGKEPVMIFPEEGIGARVFPADLSGFLNDDFRLRGVTVMAGKSVVGLEVREDRVAVKSGDGREILVDGVVAGIGIEPDTALARAARLVVDNGIVVNEFLQTSYPTVYAAGDVASFLSPHLEKRVRVEHEDNATAMGRRAGRNMAGENRPYDHLPFFYSDLFDMGYEAVGDLDPRLTTVSDWMDGFRRGVVYYLGRGRVRGVLLWNVRDQVEAARDLIAQPGPFAAKDLVGRLTG